jgi:hypothetical protein
MSNVRLELRKYYEIFKDWGKLLSFGTPSRCAKANARSIKIVYQLIDIRRLQFRS